MIQELLLARRSFLRAAALAACAAVLHDASTANAGATSHAKTRFQDRLLGPIYSNPCPFKSDLSLDDAGQQKGIERAIKAGVGVFACTAGNTQYASLSFDEIKQVNRVMVETVAGRAVAIAATGDWKTEQAVEFAKFAKAIRADALQVLLPPRFGKDEDGAVNYYTTIAIAIDLPLVLHGTYTDSLMARLLKIDSIQAMKEDHSLEDYIHQQVAFGDRMVIFCGGGENRFYVGQPYGAKAYYATYSTFAPDIPMRVWRAIQAGQQHDAVQLTLKYDYPFIARFTHGVWHAALELFNVSTRQVRPPQKTLSDERVAELKHFFEVQGLTPDQYR